LAIACGSTINRPRLNARISGLLERPDDLENRVRPLRIGLYDRLAGGERNAAPLKFLKEGRTGHVSDNRVPAARWELEHGAILSHKHVKAGQVSSDVMEIAQPASRDQSDHDAAPPRLTDGVAHGRLEYAVDGDGAVVVEREGREFHGFKISRGVSRSGEGDCTAGAPPVFRAVDARWQMRDQPVAWCDGDYAVQRRSRSVVRSVYINTASISSVMWVLTIDSFAVLTVPTSARTASVVSGITIAGLLTM
jgi:hypothetical protein